MKTLPTMSAEQEVKRAQEYWKIHRSQKFELQGGLILILQEVQKLNFREVQNLNHQKYKKQTSRGSETELAEVQDLAPIYTNYK